MAITPQDVFEYHRRGRPGKIEVTPTKPLQTQRDLSLAYTPGVAEAVLEIERDPLTAYELTAKANLVAVISNGTAILGLGNQGPAGQPSPSWKAKASSSSASPTSTCSTSRSTPKPSRKWSRSSARSRQPSAASTWKTSKRRNVSKSSASLREELDIPVFHDDQHGTAIISGAALLNAVKVNGKRIERPQSRRQRRGRGRRHDAPSFTSGSASRAPTSS